MATVEHPTLAPPDPSALAAVLARQRAASLAEAPADAATRIDRIDRLIDAVISRRDDLIEALRTDYGHRSPTQSLGSDVLSSVTALEHSRRHLERWMRPQRRGIGVGAALAGLRAHIESQPLGVVGIISPWNFPVTLSIHPLGQALAAGNRAMVKVSEVTPATAAVLAEAIAQAFDPAEVSVVTGGPDVAESFSRLAFDHLFFTGSTSVGRLVMAAAAENLVPVTLELGGKCPAVVAPGANLERAARAIMFGKTFNAGQFCVAPDYAFISEADEANFIQAARDAVADMYPTGIVDDDYTAIIDDRHLARLTGYVSDARAHGAEIVPLTNDPFPSPGQTSRKVPPTLLRSTADSMQITEEEVFGPLLPVLTYRQIDEPITFINQRPRPLAAYYFGPANRDRDEFLRRTVSGGVTINDIMLHVGLESLPFGGVGASGIGTYHGRAGFETFSHAKPVVIAPWFGLTRFASPPYSERAKQMLGRLVDHKARSTARRRSRNQARRQARNQARDQTGPTPGTNRARRDGGS